MGTETSLLFRHGLTLDLSCEADREQRRGRHFHWLAAPAKRQYLGELRRTSRGLLGNLCPSRLPARVEGAGSNRR